MSQISIFPAQQVNTTGLATASNQVLEISALNSIDTKLTSPLTVSLPTGASTAALQTTGNASLSSIDTKLTSPLTTKITDGAGVVNTKQLGTQLTNSDIALVTNTVIHGRTSGVSSTFVDVLVSAAGALTVDATVSSSALPTGASTSALQTTGNSSLSSIDTKTPALGQALAAASVPVVLTAAQLSTLTPLATVAVSSISSALPAGTNTIGTVKLAGLANANAPVYNVYSSTPVNTSAYTELIASTTSAAINVSVFDSSGQAMILAIGSAGSEVVQRYIQPGGETFTLAIPAGTRVAIKALTADATSGYILLNLLG